MKKLLLTLFILTGYTTFSQSWWNSEKVRGNGNITIEERLIGTFNEVNTGGSFDVILTEGREGKLTLEGEENILPYIITEVKDDKLKIKVKNNTNIKFTQKLTITVPFENIETISLGGSGNVISKKTITGDEINFSVGGSGNIETKVKANTIKSSVGGSGNIRLAGSADKMKCSIAGSGNIKAYGLSVKSLKASIAGSGDIQITIKEKIKATIVGSGNVYYRGNPKSIDANSIGSGDVIKN